MPRTKKASKEKYADKWILFDDFNVAIQVRKSRIKDEGFREFADRTSHMIRTMIRCRTGHLNKKSGSINVTIL